MKNFLESVTADTYITGDSIYKHLIIKKKLSGGKKIGGCDS